MSRLLLSLLQTPSTEGMVDHTEHVLDCKQTVDSVWRTTNQDEWLSYCNSASAQSTCQIVLAHPDSITDKLASRKIHHEVQISYVR